MIATPDWVKHAVFYQIFPDRFARIPQPGEEDLNLENWDSPPTIYGYKGGNLYGVIDKLDYLEDLGISAIYFNPIFASAANHRYHTYDYYQVDPLLGGNQALRLLLDQAHQRGIRIVLDGVFNHASRGLWQFHHTLENRAASPYLDWFHFDPDRLSGKKPWDLYAEISWEDVLKSDGRSLKAYGYQAWWDLPALPKFNTDTPAVRRFIFDVAEYWIRFGIDGWRLDVPAEIDDDSFWQEFRQRVKAINSEAYIVGEIWHEARRWLAGDQFDAVMNYPITMASMGFFAKSYLNLIEANRGGGYEGKVRPLDGLEFARQIEEIFSLYDPAIDQVQLNLLESHDTPRLINCVDGDINSLKLAALFMFTIPGAPTIYYGTEIGLDGGMDPDCRKSFPWDENCWDQDLRAFFKDCIRLRLAHPALRIGDYRVLHVDQETYAFERCHAGERIMILLNSGDETKTIQLPGKAGQVLWGEGKALPKGGGFEITLTGRRGVVVEGI